jgi:hypothetical protein
MGALRAAELTDYGMIGHGRIYADYVSGKITADDEVTLLHGTEEEDYAPYTEALVNVRYALLQAVNCESLDASTAHVALQEMSKVPFSDRTIDTLLAAISNSISNKHRLASVRQILKHREDAKQIDAEELLTAVRTMKATSQRGQNWHLHKTVHLRQWQRTALTHAMSEEGADNRELHRMIQVVAIDYPTFRYRTGARALAMQWAKSTAPPTQLTVQQCDCGCQEHGKVSVSCMSDTWSIDQHTCHAVLDYLRASGYLGPDELINEGLDRWCTRDEKTLLPTAVRATRGATRALINDATLAWSDPIIDALTRTGSYAKVRTHMAAFLTFQRKLQRDNPTFRVTQLKEANILEFFLQRWGRENIEDAVIERGFATVPDFLIYARKFYLYEKSGVNALRLGR